VEGHSRIEPEKPLVSFVVPVFNEEDNVMSFYADVRQVIDPLGDEYEFEFVFTDNHSTEC
jgi:dolichol-phosphate mannosyltransferase